LPSRARKYRRPNFSHNVFELLLLTTRENVSDVFVMMVLADVLEHANIRKVYERAGKVLPFLTLCLKDENSTLMHMAIRCVELVLQSGKIHQIVGQGDLRILLKTVHCLGEINGTDTHQQHFKSIVSNIVSMLMNMQKNCEDEKGPIFHRNSSLNR
jgi:hypothetical protein